MQRLERRLAIAVGLSVLLHGAFLSWRTQQHGFIPSVPYVAQINMQWLRRPAPVPVPVDVPKPSLARKAMPMPVVTHHEASGLGAIVSMPPPQQAEPPQADAPPAEPVSPSLYDRARAGLRSAERDAIAESPKDLVKRKTLPANLAPQPEEPLSKFAERFEQYLGDERVLTVREHQEGNNRVTMIHTNRRNYCYYEPILAHRYLGNMPAIGKFGDCGPQS